MACTDGEPGPRLIRTPEDASAAAGEWMTRWGFEMVEPSDIRRGSSSAILAQRAVAHVRALPSKTGATPVQALAGIAAARGDEGLYFSLGGYTTEALAFAEEAGVAAFSFDLQGKPAALTSAAARLVTRGEAVPREPAHASDTSAEAVLGDRRLRGESRDFTCDECGTVNPDIYAGQLTDLACECNADLGDYGSLITSCDLCQRFVPEALTRWNGTTVCQHCVTRLEMRDCDVCGRPREMSDLIRFSSESGLVEVVACDVESDDRGPCASQFRAIEEALWRAASARKLAEPEHWRLRS